MKWNKPMKTVEIEIPDNKNIIWKDDNTLVVIDADITDRIKTFEDALNELGNKHPLVVEYNSNLKASKNLIAYCKLRIIVAALNEGWEPKFEKNEFRYFPWFYLYTKENYDKLDDKKKERCISNPHYQRNEKYNFIYCYTLHDGSFSNTYYGFGSRLAFKTKNLAGYAGKQFVKEYLDYLIDN